MSPRVFAREAGGLRWETPGAHPPERRTYSNPIRSEDGLPGSALTWVKCSRWKTRRAPCSSPSCGHATPSGWATRGETASRENIPTPAPHRTPALAGGARGCGEEHRDGAVTGCWAGMCGPGRLRDVGRRSSALSGCEGRVSNGKTLGSVRYRLLRNSDGVMTLTLCWARKAK